jgi:Winged helix-turn-helix DNA-binding
MAYPVKWPQRRSQSLCGHDSRPVWTFRLRSWGSVADHRHHVSFPSGSGAGLAFLTNHAQVLICVSQDPGIRLRDIGEAVGITERAAHRILGELEVNGYLSRQRHGRRISYTVYPDRQMGDPLSAERNVGELISFLSASNGRDGASRNGGAGGADGAGRGNGARRNGSRRA